LGALNLLIVSDLVSWRLWAMRLRRDAGRWLLAFFGAVLALALLWMLAGTRLDDWRYVALHAWGLIWKTAAVCLIQYSYRLGEVDPEHSEAHMALVIGLAGLGFIIFVLLAGHIEFFPGIIGPALWIGAALFSSMGHWQRNGG
jgi:hypothetical protein